ncbi:hypothetical protein [Leptolyngbya sp. FACHB-261]|uniref:hypothetical protein n=1 Tax=Leptolyngbya sp. FACHB-261 TaxID=2692806 RepID=UPI001688CC28|nr:hypothetical protein [Leptolyngbya sp. FACHB-261]MBD2100302.1 hypothetical protein [Leptolyngbya sp. FACHB-261]
MQATDASGGGAASPEAPTSFLFFCELSIEMVEKINQRLISVSIEYSAFSSTF